MRRPWRTQTCCKWWTAAWGPACRSSAGQPLPSASPVQPQNRNEPSAPVVSSAPCRAHVEHPCFPLFPSILSAPADLNCIHAGAQPCSMAPVPPTLSAAPLGPLSACIPGYAVPTLLMPSSSAPLVSTHAAHTLLPSLLSLSLHGAACSCISANPLSNSASLLPLIKFTCEGHATGQRAALTIVPEPVRVFDVHVGSCP